MRELHGRQGKRNKHDVSKTPSCVFGGKLLEGDLKKKDEKWVGLCSSARLVKQF